MEPGTRTAARLSGLAPVSLLRRSPVPKMKPPRFRVSASIRSPGVAPEVDQPRFARRAATVPGSTGRKDPAGRTTGERGAGLSCPLPHAVPAQGGLGSSEMREQGRLEATDTHWLFRAVPRDCQRAGSQPITRPGTHRPFRAVPSWDCQRAGGLPGLPNLSFSLLHAQYRASWGIGQEGLVRHFGRLNV